MSRYPRILPVGDSAFTVEFGATIEERLVAQVQDFEAVLDAHPIPGVRETVPSYCALLVVYDPQLSSAAMMQLALEQALTRMTGGVHLVGRLIEIPVRYGTGDGPDLQDVADFHQLSPEEVIALHTAPTYRVAMLGFAPGFAYLVGLDPRLATPRLATPRTYVAPGSVGIAGNQTGVYALSTPGGWRIIGRTSLVLFEPTRPEPFLLHAGDSVRFVQA
ncbi:MAG: 5-oxoprolinase subunit PxpB [Anaerolineae bacterium]|nr:5-oxoprolinase subunit PxpB [Anaerolineae bacterium]